MLVFWGNGSQQAKDLVSQISVRSTDNFNWTFIFILAVVFYVYWSEINKKNYDAIFAGLALYGVHWLYEIGNAIIGHFSGYPLWSVSNDSTTFILLIGVCWELSMMFSLAGIISFKMLPTVRSAWLCCLLLSNPSLLGPQTILSSGFTNGGVFCLSSSPLTFHSSWRAITFPTWCRQRETDF